MPNNEGQVGIRLDIFPEVYGSGMSVKELTDSIQSASKLNPEDKLLLLSGDTLKTITLEQLQEAIGGGSGGGGVDNLHTFAVITE